MIEAILPPHVVAASVRGEDPTAALWPEEEARVRDAIEPRRREYTLGRACARRALEKLGIAPRPVLTGNHREPIWPEGVVGSITHCEGYAAAAVALRTDVAALGIDAERHLPLPLDVRRSVCLPEELAALEGAPAGVAWDRVLFCAKEATFKAYFARCEEWLGFEDASISFPARDAFTFSARLRGSPNASFTGRYFVDDDFVLASVILPPS